MAARHMPVGPFQANAVYRASRWGDRRRGAHNRRTVPISVVVTVRRKDVTTEQSVSIKVSFAAEIDFRRLAPHWHSGRRFGAVVVAEVAATPFRRRPFPVVHRQTPAADCPHRSVVTDCPCAAPCCEWWRLQRVCRRHHSRSKRNAFCLARSVGARQPIQ
jgi:hypothetical protein